MSKLRLRAVVLAAGRGERLRPLTDFEPKPLLPVGGRAVAEHTFAALAAVGCEAVALNLHHLGDRVRDVFEGAVNGMPITYSPEEKLLGTLGALVELQGFLSPADLVIVINGDSLCNWPLRGLIRKHQKTGAVATLMVSRRADTAEFGGGVGFDKEGKVVSFRSDRSIREVAHRHVFAGAHVFSPGLLDGLLRGPADTITDLYEPLMAAGEPIQAYLSRRRWFDLGTPTRYLDGATGWALARLPGLPPRRTALAPGAEVAEGARLRGVVIERGAGVAAGAKIERSLLLPGAKVAEDCRVSDCILGFDVHLPAGTSVEGRMITPLKAHVDRREGDTVVGGMVYTPIVRRAAVEAGAAG